MAVVEQGDLRIDVVDRVNHVIWLLSVLPLLKLPLSRFFIEELVAAVKVRPRRYLLQSPLKTQHLRSPHVGQGGDGVAVERAERDLVKVDEA